MFFLPLVFLINTIVFIMCLEERFKLYVNASLLLASYLISIIFTPLVTVFFDNVVDASITASGFNAFVLLITSILFSSNNIAHKILVTLLVQFNFLISTLIIPQMLSISSISTAGLIPSVVGNVFYLLLSLLTIAIFRGPLHHFFRRSINLYSVLACVLMYLACMNVGGFVAEIIGYNSFEIKFFTGLFCFLAVVVVMRSTYSASKSKERDFKRLNTEICSGYLYNNISNTLADINTFKTAKNNLDYTMEQIKDIAIKENNTEIVNYIDNSDYISSLKPFLKSYNENIYLNAIIAAKTVMASEKNIELLADVEVNEFDSRIKHIYVLINQMLDIGIKSAMKSSSNNLFIHINSQQSGTASIYEVTFSKEPKIKTEFDFVGLFTKENLLKLANTTLEIIIDNFVNTNKELENYGIEFLADMVKRLDGTMSTSSYADKSGIKIILKN